MRIHVTVNELLDKCTTSDYLTQITSKENITSSLSGVLVFPTVLGLLHHTWKFLGVAAHSKFAPFCSLLTVSTSGLVSTLVTISVRDYHMGLPALTSSCLSDITVCTALSFFCFAILARRLKVVMPSHVLHRGAFARKSIRLPEITSRATESQKRRIQNLGFKYGCHTCGIKYCRLHLLNRRFKEKWFPTSRKANSLYYADHSPPVALAPIYLKKNKNKKGELLPQCQSCSNFQATRVRLMLQSPQKYKKWGSLVTHSTNLKLWKLWLPWPVLVNSDVLINSFHNAVEVLVKFI